MKLHYPNSHHRRALLRTVLAQLLLLLSAAAGFARPGKAQELLEQPVTLRVAETPIRTVLHQIENQTGARFVYSHQLIRANRKVSVTAEKLPLAAVLAQLLPPLQLKYEVLKTRILLNPVTPPTTGSVSPEAAPAPAQGPGDITVAGRVTSGSTGEPLPGVTVLVKGTANGTATNVSGAFLLTVPPGSTLVISSVGMVTQEIVVQEATNSLVVALANDVKALQEVVVVAYGTQRRSSLTGAVSSVEAAALESRPVLSATQALQGTAPNLTVQQNSAEPGAPLNINIRGISTLGSNQPLIIVDGIPGSLDALNPNDIESVSVLKDAASASIYGSRGANGVLLVTTKKGATNTRPTVTYNTLVGWQEANFLRRPVSGVEFMQLKNEALANSGQALAFTPQQIRAQAAAGDQQWYLDAILKKRAVQQNHNLSLSGGTESTRYLLSLGYLNQSSLLVGEGYGLKRANARLSVTTQVSKRLRVGGIVSYAQVNIKEHPFDTQWIIGDAVRIPRIYPLQDASGAYIAPPTSGSNPLHRLLNGGQRTNLNDNLYGNLTAEYLLLPGLRARAIVGGDLWQYRTDQFQKSLDYVLLDGTATNGADGQNNVQTKQQRTLLTNYQATLNYDHAFAERHVVQLLGGYSSEQFANAYSGIGLVNVPGNAFGVINNGTQPGGVSGPDGFFAGGVYGNTLPTFALNSWFGRANYAYDNRYLLEASFRYDGSSNFAPGKQWGLFPSVSAGWRISQESFMTGLREAAVSELKLRGSIGQLGNQDIGRFRYLSTIRSVPGLYAFGNTLAPGAIFNAANPDIKWETATMGNVGLDLGLWDNALTLSLDAFDKRTRDILIDLPVAGTYGYGAPGTQGGGSPTQNAANVRNRGWEVALTYRHQLPNGFRQSLTLNLADNLNTVTDTRGTDIIKGGDTQNIIREGFPIGSYFGLKSDGLYQTLEQTRTGPQPSFIQTGSLRPGDVRYVDRNGDNVIDEKDRFVLGNPFPRYTFGATYTGAWQGFDLLVFVQGVGKRSVYIRGEGVEAFHNNWDNVYQQHLDRWTPTNTDASYPRLTIGGASSNNNAVSDYWLRDASYARLKNVQLGYTLPTALTQKAGIQRLRVYASGQDLFTISRMRDIGFDPEITEFNSSVGQGVSNNSLDGKVSSGRVYPSVRVVAFGLDVTF